MIRFDRSPEEDERPSGGAGTIEFVGGPRSGERIATDESPDRIEADDGWYRRSVRCADDGALRYVWEGARRAP